jgi:hypothetical protein
MSKRIEAVYSSARGGERNKMVAAISPSPKIGKKAPPKSSELVAMRLNCCATSFTCTLSTIILGASVRGAKAGRVTVDGKGLAKRDNM